MDRLILDRKLDSLQRCITRITSKQPANVQVLLADIDLQDVLVLNISRAVQICVDLATHLLANANLSPPNTMGEAFDQLASLGVIDQALALRMKYAVGFRNIAVHAYSSIDWNIVFAISTKHLEDFRSFATAVLRSAHGSTV